MKHKFYFFLKLFVVISAFSSCIGDDYEYSQNNDDPTSSSNVNSKTLVFSYDKFNDENDVKIISADTTRILVNKNFLKKNNIEININNDSIPVVIWRTIETEPFIRNIINIEDSGKDIELTTVRGDMGDVFPNADFNLQTDVYVNNKAPKSITRSSGITSINPQRYTDEEGIIHPSVYIVKENIVEIDQDGNPINNTTKAIDKNYFTAEELYAENADFRILNVDYCFADREYNLYDDNDINVKFYAKGMHIKAKSGLKVNIKTRWFKLKSFECIAYGDMYSESEFGFLAKSSGTLDFEKEFAKFGSCTSIFWVGAIPVAVSVNTGLKVVGSMDMSAECDISTNINCNANFETGVEWKNGWDNISYGYANVSHGLNFSNKMKFDTNADIAALVYANVSLYGCGGPGIELGPQITANASAEINYLASQEGFKETLSANYNINTNLIGKVTAELRILKWQLAYWEYPFEIWEGPSYSKSWTEEIN